MDHDTPDSPDHDTPTTSASGGLLTPEDHPFLHELDPDQWTYSGTAVVKTLVRPWPDGSEDTLIVLSPDSAYVRRDDPGKGLVKQERGTAVEMARLIQHVPAPGTPDAPNDPIEQHQLRDPML